MGIKEELYKKSLGKAKKINIDGEIVYLKKTGIVAKDWQKINPPVEEKDGKLEWNKLNLCFGGKKNLIKLILIMLLLSLAYYEITSLLGDAKDWTDGHKYVIVERNTFDKFCKASILESGGEEGIITNLSNFKFEDYMVKGG